ncbi:DNA-binding transcriptional LysR family regulator [Saccharothrix tamanrassetensis]|uniref:DNA-binding transcriptional LysR family regulator n=1 Tax=Saccharothrix tamanrassetensis TaxID=1051531 RepID=A0A841CB80_9PSEU|nr:LysR family transcriptional regulator [Saccharothrix tamanrassetensis]MBB5954240.1 DNA-binding transcriptional LysR family regulator [Saccharothrix tamanrassetensis]
MKLELRHLRVVCAIADAGSLSKASSLLGLAQPALTAQLHRIEGLLGGKLFERDHKGARPTVLGELVLERARVLLPAFSRLQEDALRLVDDDVPTDRFRVGAVNGPMLGGLVHRLTESHPGAHVSTHASWSNDELAKSVAQGRLDYVLVGVCGDAPPPTEYGLTWQVIALDPVFVLVPEDHPFTLREEVELAELKEMQWAVVPGDGCFGDCFVAACSRAGFTPRTMYEVDINSCIDLAQAGDTVALCQPTFRRAPGLVAMPIAGSPLRWRHLIGWDPESPAAAFGPQVLRYAGEAYRETAERNPRYTAWLPSHPEYGAVRHHVAVP